MSLCLFLGGRMSVEDLRGPMQGEFEKQKEHFDLTDQSVSKSQ
jgi:hypothetical protein